MIARLIKKAAEGCRTPRPCGDLLGFVERGSVLECGSPLPLSAPPRHPGSYVNRPFLLLDQCPVGSHAEAVADPVERIILTFDEQCGKGRGLVAAPLRSREIALPAYLYQGGHGGGDPIRIGLFAGIHGDEPAGSFAMARFAEWLVNHPEAGEGYQLYFYPICNPTGFAAGQRCSAKGKDLNREFWSRSAEPEVGLLESEIRSRSFHGLISLHSDDTSPGMYGFVRGAVLSRGLLEPALAAAEQILPRNTSNIIDGFAAENGIISECYDGILTSPPDLHPLPFEIILETPHQAPQRAQEEAFLAALQRILMEYRKLLSFAADL